MTNTDIHKLVVDAVQHGFWYAQNSQHDGKAVPLGNIEQWLMGHLGFRTKTELDFFRGVKDRYEVGDDIVCTKHWEEEENGEWAEYDWADNIFCWFIDEDNFELVGVLDKDKHGHPTKAIFKKIK